MDWAAIIVGVLGLAGVGYTAWNARQTKRDELAAKKAEVERPDWPSYATELRTQVDTLRHNLESSDARIDDLYKRLGDMRNELVEEKSRSSTLQLKLEAAVTYIVRVIGWAAEVTQGQTPPRPPAIIQADIGEGWWS